MTRKSKDRLLIVFYTLVFSVAMAVVVECFGQELNGPVKADPGTLCTFAITPAQEAAWTIACDGTDDVSFATDTSKASIYFATINPGKYAIIAAIVVDGKPKQLVARLVIGGETPNPKPEPNPEVGIVAWLKSRVPEAVDNPTGEEYSAVATACSAITERIDRGTLKTVSAAQTRLQIELVSALALAGEKSVLRWNAFLPEMANKITEQLKADQNDDVTAYKTVLIEVEKWFAGKAPEATTKTTAEPEPEPEPVKANPATPKQVCTPQGCPLF